MPPKHQHKGKEADSLSHQKTRSVAERRASALTVEVVPRAKAQRETEAGARSEEVYMQLSAYDQQLIDVARAAPGSLRHCVGSSTRRSPAQVVDDLRHKRDGWNP